MSKEIDERVVSMQFDNKHFEKNVSATMSTLDKLKEKLKFTGATKGLETVNTAANKVNMNGLGSAVETVHAKFSALEVMGVTALANITNSAVNAGKRIVSALTIDPIKTGFQEYETQINAVQTILANTSSKGTTIDDVNLALEELNKYADKTIYNFTEMTRNIGTFTAAGIDLDTSVNAIQGIANLAAVSGSTSQQASTAMYQLSQALAAGTVKLMDWNSVVNAGMGGQVFQDALKETARAHGIAIDDIIEKQGSFRESLSEGWITSEILTETLQKFTLTTEGLTDAQIEANREMLRSKGYTEAQIDEIFKLGKTATDAATKVKTFTQLWDVIKESAQSGWSQTWKIIVGDFEEAKNLLTPLSDFMTGVINSFSEARNKLLEGALGKTFTGLVDKVEGITAPIKDSAESVKEVVDSVKDYARVVDEILSGKWGDGQERWNKLAEAGYDWAHAQNLVNEKLGDATRHQTDYTEAQKSSVSIRKKSNKQIAKTLELMLDLSDAELEAKGVTEDQIKALRELGEISYKTGIPIRELIENIDKIDGRYLLINSFKNVGQGLVSVFKAMGDAWKEIFPPMTSDQLFDIIAGLHKLSTYMVVSEETADKLQRTFKGVFAAFDIVLTVLGGPLKLAFRAITSTLGAFDLNILDVTANIGDAIVEFNDWIDSIFDFSDIMKKIPEYVNNISEAISGWLDGLKETDDMSQYIVDSISKAFDGVESALSDKIKNLGPTVSAAIGELLGGFIKIPEDIVQGFENGLLSGIGAVVKHMFEFGKRIIAAICEVLGIESPSTVMYGVGENVVEGLVNGIVDGAKAIWEAIKSIGKYVIDSFKNFDWSAISAVTWLVSALFPSASAFNLVSAIANFLALAGETIISTIKDILGIHSPSTVMYEIGQNIIQGLVNGISAGLHWVIDGVKSIGNKIVEIFKEFEIDVDFTWLTNAFDKLKEYLVNFDFEKLLAIIPIGAVLFMVKQIYDVTKALADGIDNLNDVIGGLAEVEKSFSKVLNSFALSVKADALKKIAISLAILVGSVIALTMVEDTSKLYDAVAVIGILAGVLAILAFAMEKMNSASVSIGKGGVSMDGLKSGLTSIGIALLLLAATVKIIGEMDPEKAKQGFAALIGLMAILGAVVAACIIATGSGSTEHFDKVGKMMTKLSIALLLMVGVCKLAGMLDENEMKKGAAFAAAFAIFVIAITKVSKDSKDSISKVGSMVLKISIAMALMVGVCKLVAMLTPEEMIKGAAFAVAFGLFVWGLNKAARIGKKKEIAKLGGLLLSISASMLLMVGVFKLVDTLSVEEAVKGTVFLTGFMIFLKALLKVTTIGNDQQIAKAAGTILATSIAVGILAGLSILLSMMPLDGLIKGVAAVTVLGLVMTGMIWATRGANSVVGNLIVMSVAIGIMVISVAALANIDQGKLAGATIALTVLMGMFGILIKVSGTATKSIGTLIVITAAVTILSGILYLLAKMPIESTLGAAASLSIMMLSLAAFVLIVGKIPPTAVSTAIGNMIGLAILLGELAILVAACALVGQIPGVDWLMTEGGNFLEKLGTAIGQFVGGIAGGIAKGFTSSLPEIGTDLSNFMTNVTPFIEGIKMVDSNVLKNVAYLSGAILALTAADLVAGIASFVSGGASFAQLGTELGEFMTNASTFIEGAAAIDPAVAEGAKSLAQTILALTAANVVDSLLGWATGGQSLSDFATQLQPFGEGMKAYADEVAGIDAAAITASAEAAKGLAEVAKAIPKSGDGIWQAITGENNLETFGKQLVPFGTGMKDYAAEVTGLNTEAITNSVTAAQSLAEVAKAIPKNGDSIWGAIAGEKDLGTFGSQLTDFGKGLKTYSTEVAGIDTEAISTSVTATNKLIEVAEALPSDSLWDKITGKQDLGDFADKLVPFGEGMKTYADKVSGIDAESMNGSISAAKKLAKFVSGIADLDTSGVSDFKKAVKSLGETSFDGFKNAFKDASLTASDIGAKMIESLAAGIKIGITKLPVIGTQAYEAFVNSITSKKDAFGKIGVDLMNVLAAGIKSKVTAVTASINAVMLTSVSTINNHHTSFYTAGSNLVSGFASGISANSYKATAQARAMATAAKQAAEEALGINSPSKVFREIGSFTVEGFAKGILEKLGLIGSSSEDVAEAAVEATKEGISNNADKMGNAFSDSLNLMYVSGQTEGQTYFVDIGALIAASTAEGITEHEYEAINATVQMMQSCITAAKRTAQINSPSKVFIAMGRFIPEGLANGIDKTISLVKSSADGMVEAAMSSTKNAIARISDAINSDIDSQPTIRPVLDLSDVRSAAGSISGLLNSDSSIGASAHIRAISANMNQNRTNNNDVVSAIKDLGKKISSSSGDTYSINGITYDDGSNISDAVKTLVRAARIERRI